MAERLCIFCILQVALLSFGIAKKSTMFDFAIISNSSFPCEESPTEVVPFSILDKESLGHAARYTLTDDDLEMVLTAKGGSFLSAYMAKNNEDAENNFNVMLPIKWTENDTFPGFGSTYGRVRKQRFMSWLRAQRNLQSQKVPAPHLPREVPDEERATSSQDPETQELETKLPFLLPEDIDGPKAFPSGPNNQECNPEVCWDRKTLLPGGTYYNMCKLCSATCTLDPVRFWPAIFNAAICSDDDFHCMFYQGDPTGLCQMRDFSINILRRQDGYCELALKGGEIVIVERYDIYPHTLSMGCECTINQHSPFAPYL